MDQHFLDHEISLSAAVLDEPKSDGLGSDGPESVK